MYIREFKKEMLKMTVNEEKIKEFKKYLGTLGYSKTSVYQLPACVRDFLENHANIELSGITADHLKNFHEYLDQRPNKRKPGGLSQSRITHYLYALKLFFNYLEMSDQIKENPMSSLIFPSPESNTREILTQQEIQELYETAETYRDKAILGIIYGCGLRKSEAENLNISDVHFRENLLYVRKGKGRKRRVIPLTARVLEDLKKYFYDERSSCIKVTTTDNQQAFILNKKGDRLKGERYYSRIKELIKLTKNEKIKSKNIGLHGLRHSIATHLLENGVKVEYVRDFLGHQFLETTKIYTRVSEKQLKNV